MQRLRFCLIPIVSAALGMGAFGALETTEAAPAGSKITIHVHKSGLFSAFGHDHLVTAPIAEAQLDSKAMTAEIVVATREMKVIDPEASQADRTEIQATMLGPQVLNSEKFPEIRFQSSHVEEIANQRYRVEGKLTLHGVEKALSFEVEHDVAGRYHGKTRLRQTDFGIQPVSVAGGTVKVKDEIDVEFEIFQADKPQKRAKVN